MANPYCRDHDYDTSHTCSVLKQLGVTKVTESDIAVVREVCAVVSARASHLVAGSKYM